MISRNVPFEREPIEQRSLFDLPMPHHDSVLSRRLNQRETRRATEDFFNTIGHEETSRNGRPSRSESDCPMSRANDARFSTVTADRSAQNGNHGRSEGFPLSQACGSVDREYNSAVWP